jgi:predicted KAP-like P-loop ATPase
MVLSDNETKVDLLNSEPIASTIIKLIETRSDHPITIGVHGDWGAGKSSVLEMIESGLTGDDDFLCIKFNSWRFQGFEDAKIALIEGIVSELIEKRSLGTKAAEAVKGIYKRIDWLKIAKKTGGFALSALTGIPTPEVIQSVFAGFEGMMSDPTKLLTKANLENAVSHAKSILKPEEESKNILEEIGEFRKAFDELLSKAGVKRLIVLIDDLDRCLPETAIDTLEAIRLFLFTPKTAFVVAADEAMIEYAVRRHFPDLSDSAYGAQVYARNYLEKLIQVPFKIPILGETETKIYVSLLLIGAELGGGDPGFAT